MTPLDKFDIKILESLQTDASISNARLSEIVHLSPSQCHRRVGRLKTEGYIRRFVALLDQHKLGMEINVVVIIKVHKVTPEAKADFTELVNNSEMITECWAIIGEKDVLLRIVAPSMEAYSSFLSEKILGNRNVATAESYLLLNNMKQTTSIPLGI